jgi:hypothetical protein
LRIKFADYSSDLLIRHERLTHNKDGSLRNQRQDRAGANEQESSQSTGKRRRIAFENSIENDDGHESPRMSNPMNFRGMSSPANPILDGPSNSNQNDEYSLAALSMAAEYSALHGDFTAATPFLTQSMPQGPSVALRNDQLTTPVDSLQGPYTNQSQGLGFEDSLDSLAAFLDNDLLSSYHFSSLISTEQPMVYFSPESWTNANDFMPHSTVQETPHLTHNNDQSEEPNSFSRFGSRLPSLQPEECAAQSQQQKSINRPFSELSSDDRHNVTAKLAEFSSVVSLDFQLPSRLALSRYIAAYINGFHEHLPFLHLATMTIEGCSLELILAMAAVGAQYCFEGEKGVELFNASQSIAAQRIRRRDARLVSFHRRAGSEFSSTTRGPDGSSNTESPAIDSSTSGPLGLPSEPDVSATFSLEREDLIQTAQALLILMAMATWAKHKEILREALAIQSVLATLIRDDGLQSQPLQQDISWEDWVRFETTKRTKFIVFCFFNLHCIVYNIPPLILNSEIKLTLPCSASEFKAPNPVAWKDARRKRSQEIEFQEAFRRLFLRKGRNTAEWNSSLGNYVLIHAVIQHIFFVRQIAKYRFDGPGELTPEEISSLENALRNWQLGWNRNPESSLDPMNPNGPVAFNSTALLRLAYIRLNVDTGPGRALDTRDSVQIANAFRDSPPIKRTPKLVRAVLHSAHALSVPVKIGIRLVAKTQTFIWSIQHSLCSLECAFLLSKWLEAISLPNPEPPISDDERRISSLVKTMLDETEFAVPDGMSPSVMNKCLSAGVLRVWATIFKGAQTWAIVDVIGSSLNIYADMLESS